MYTIQVVPFDNAEKERTLPMTQFTDLSATQRSAVLYKLRELVEKTQYGFNTPKWHRRCGSIYALHHYIAGDYDVFNRRANMTITNRDANK